MYILLGFDNATGDWLILSKTPRKHVIERHYQKFKKTFPRLWLRKV